MKYLPIILIALPFFTFSQVMLYNPDLINKDSAIVYSGIENPLKIEGLDSLKKYELTSSSGIVSLRNQQFYYIRYNTSAKYDTIAIKFKNKVLLSKVFRIDLLNDVVVRLGNYPPGYITKQQIAGAQKLNIIIPGCQLTPTCDVLSFSIYGKCSKCDELPVLQATGSFLPRGLPDLLKFLKPGDQLIFDDIKMKCRDCLTRKLRFITYTIR